MSNLISRQAAIDAIGEKSDEIYKTKQKGATYPHNDFFQGMAYAADIVKNMPSAQPVIRTEMSSANDTISRQEAILAIERNAYRHTYVDQIVDIIKWLPSAQPETAKRIVGKSRDGMTLWYQCDMCNEPVHEKDEFCPGCGRRLKDG